MDEEQNGSSRAARLSRLLHQAEIVYLRLLRAVVLVLATLLIGYAIWLATTALYKVSRSPESVVEKRAAVAAQELVHSDLTEANAAENKKAKTPQASPEERRRYGAFVASYFDLYRSKFETFKRAEDKSLTRDEFDDAFVESEERLNSVAKGDLDAATDLADLDALLAAMTSAASDPVTVKKLQTYRGAQKVQVCANVERFRTEYRRGWDSLSTACSNWYEYPVGCAVRRSVSVPYQERVCSMQLPKGTTSHTQLFQAYQAKFFELLMSRRQENVQKASFERAEIQLGIVEGKATFLWAAYVFGAFLLLMFFFLLIAIERHQRRLSAQTTPGPAE